MLPTIATGNVASALGGEYEVANSLRFNDDSSDFLEKNFSSTQDSRRIFTVSAWLKRCKISDGDQRYWGSSEGTGEGYNSLGFDGSDRLKILSGNTTNSGTQLNFASNQLFRDVTAWSHIVYAVDTTQSTESNRVKIYHNGSQITSFNTATYPSQNTDILTSTTPQMTIGMRDLRGTNANFFDGYLAEFVFIDNQQLDPTSFGEFDSDSPNIWKPKNVSSLNFGTNGFHLDFEDSSSLGADVSGNSNNFTVNNLTSIDQTTDTCTNNFSTLNSILGNTGVNAFSEGNTVVEFTGGGNGSSLSTFGLQAGRWYAECKIITTGNGAGVGIFGERADINAWVNIVDGLVYVNSGQKNVNGTETSGVGATFTDNDIIGVALDITSGDVEFFKNGASQFTLNLSDMLTGGNSDSTYFFGFSDASGATSGKGSYNFGNPSFTISSGNADANGFGNFEHSVPSGFFACCTKNLAEFG
tara:strand:+ start:511 stop:1920 length:1410 start_codon:yes stop_codon:yes gene_type:complete